jgi:hypothetical protein
MSLGSPKEQDHEQEEEQTEGGTADKIMTGVLRGYITIDREDLRRVSGMPSHAIPSATGTGKR